MSDRTSALVKIGGTLDRAKLRELCELIEDECLGIDWDSRDDADELMADAEDCATKGTPFIVMGNEVGGMFEALEAFCRENSLAYKRGDDGHYTWTPGVGYWEPGMEHPREWTGTVDDHIPHLSANEIRRFVADGELDAELNLMDKASNFSVPFTLIGNTNDDGDASTEAEEKGAQAP